MSKSLLDYKVVLRMVARMESPGIDNERLAANLEEFAALIAATQILIRRTITEIGFVVADFGVEVLFRTATPIVSAAADLLLSLIQRSAARVLAQIDRLIAEILLRRRRDGEEN